MKDYRFFSLVAVLIAALMVVSIGQVHATEHMQINRLGISQILPYSYKEVGVIGDSLAFFDYDVSSNSVTLKCGFITHDAVVIPQQVIHSFDAPPDWGAISAYPLYFKFQDGKLFAAFNAGSHSLVLISDVQSTAQHIFSHDNTSLEHHPGYVIVNEQYGWCSPYSYPVASFVQIYRIDLTTDTLQPFYETSTTSYINYNFYPLAGNHFLVTASPYDDLPDLLIQDSQIIHTYTESWMPNLPFYIMSSTQPITDELSYISISDGIQRYQTWSFLAWVENSQLSLTGIPNSGEHPYSFSYIHDFVPNSSHSFSSVYGIGIEYPPILRDQTVFKNWQFVSGTLEDIGGFPDLSAFSGAKRLFRLSDDYAVAISGPDQDPHSFCLVDYNDLVIREYNYQVGYYNKAVYGGNRFFLIGIDGRVHCFALEMGSSNQDQHLPIPSAKLSAYPNPFRSSCSIELSGNKGCPAKLSIYNVRGQHIQTLFNAELPSHPLSIEWDASAHCPGIYFIRLESHTDTVARKILLLK